jgi:predicted aspartyl protease
LSAVIALVSPSVLGGEPFAVSVPMHSSGLTTYYVSAQVADLGASEFMVDTGSGYLTINEQTLTALQARNQVQYVKKLKGILADGTELIIPVYAIDEFRIGNNCTIRNVEAAVFPGRARQILGLSVLKKAAPFAFSVDPPQLMLSNCGTPPPS